MAPVGIRLSHRNPFRIIFLLLMAEINFNSGDRK